MLMQAIGPDVAGPDNNKQDPVLQSVGEMDILSPNYHLKWNMESIMATFKQRAAVSRGGRT